VSSVYFGSIETFCFGIEAKQPKRTVSKQTEKRKKRKKPKKPKKPDTLDLAKWLERLNAKAKVATVLSFILRHSEI
jgi:hypothetical protein